MSSLTGDPVAGRTVPESIHVPDLDDDTNDLINVLAEQLRAKERRNLTRSAYYDMKRMIRQVTPVIPPQYYRLGLILGWSSKAVDLLARRCNLNGFVWPDGDLESLGYSEVWDGNMLGSEVNQGLTSSLIHATAFVINTQPDDASEPPALIHFKDALSATGQWDSRARRMKNLLSVIGRQDNRLSEFTLYLDGRTIVCERELGTWKVASDERHTYGVPVDPLPYRPRLGRPFGSSRISRAVMGLQDQAVRELVRLEGHMDVYSYPEMVMLGADSSIFRNDDGSIMNAWQIMLGRWKGIPDDDDAASDTLARADVKQFPAQSPQPGLAALNAFAKLFARETALPDTALAITDFANPTSAESYDASQYELIAEAEGATDDWSPALRRRMVCGLAMANGVPIDKVPPEWYSINTRWQDPRYQSRAALADAGMKTITAVPWLAETEVGLELLGLDDQQIRRALADRRRARGSEVLDALRQAASRAGQAANQDDGGDSGGSAPAA